MILLLETNTMRHPIAISETQEPFAQMRGMLRGLPHGVWAERFLCDREARQWVDIHAIRRSNEFTLGMMRRSPADDTFCTVFADGVDYIPIEIDDTLATP